MTTFLIISGVIMYLAAIALLFRRQIVSPIAAWGAMTTIGLSETLPINNTMIIGWLSMAFIVMAATWLQPEAIKQQRRGIWYMLIGALTGMSVGLLAFSTTTSLSLLYGIMIVATIAGLCFGFLFFTNTPRGREVGIRSGHFITYLTAKGFPIAITVMQLGIVLVLLLAVHNINQL